MKKNVLLLIALSALLLCTGCVTQPGYEDPWGSSKCPVQQFAEGVVGAAGAVLSHVCIAP